MSAQIGIFASLHPAALQKLEAIARPAVYGDGEIVMLEGEPDKPAYFLLEGNVRVFRISADGREQDLIHLRAGEALNLPAAFSSDHRAPASAIAVGAAKMLFISGAELRRLTSEQPEIALAILRDLSDRLRHFTNLTHDLSLRNVRGRLARFLLTRASEPGRADWTQEQIAAQIGSVREVVSRTLRTFAKEGLVKIERQRILIQNIEALKAEAES